MENFTPVSAAIGGGLIGLSATLLLLFNGRIAGISGILGGALRPAGGDSAWRWLFLAGLLAGGVGLAVAAPHLFHDGLDRSLGAVAVAGLLVGFGTRLGSGCTSGHGVCGLTRLSGRSAAATVTFMGTGVLAAWIANHLLAGVL